jgi:Protein of unknown function (DUF3501)
MAWLRLSDILDLRAYEREREAFRAGVIALKRARRVAIGPIVTVVFENRSTLRFQIQEMARAENMTTDAQIEGELAIYNELIPARGELSLTLFIELTSEEELRRWLPALVGIERAVLLRLGGPEGEVLRAEVDPSHAAQLTREEVTAAVHYVRFAIPPGSRERFLAGPASIGIDLPAYQHETELEDATRQSLGRDWEDA